MRKLFHETLTVMSNAFRRLEAQIDPPETVPHGDSFVYRYKEKGIEQALLQKLARSTSGLYALDLLLVHGFVQEQGVLHRTLDEIHQDIFFLTGALTNGTITEQHRQYLKRSTPTLCWKSRVQRNAPLSLIPSPAKRCGRM